MNQVRIQTDNRRNTVLLTALHATVDGLCACVMFRISPFIEDYQTMLWLFVAYNALAFVTQPLVGLWIDRRDCHVSQLVTALALLTAGGMVCLLTDSGTASALPWLAVTLIGLGNSIFHVYGGKEVTVRTGNDIRHLGIFVSSGALGLMLGGQYVSDMALTLIMALLVLLTLAYLLTTHGREMTSSIAAPNHAPHEGEGWLLAFLALVVFIRSFIGKQSPTSTEVIPYYAILAVLLAVLGKASGGFLAQWGGVWRMLTVLLLLTGCSFLLGYFHAIFVLLMVLCINLTMPFTLYLANQALPRSEGFAFGLLAAALAPGVGLAVYCEDIPEARLLLYTLVATILIEALVLLCLGERRWQVLAMSLAMNVLTNLTLNAVVLFCLADYPTTPQILAFESCIALIEALLFLPVTHSWRRAVSYSLLCNATSFLLGLIIPNI